MEPRHVYVTHYGLKSGYNLFFWGFVVVKLAGHVFDDWSWLWVFIPIVPWIGLLVEKAGL